MLLELLVIADCLGGGIASRSCYGQAHWFFEYVKPLQVSDSSLRGLGIVEDNERLAFRPKVCLNNDIDDVSVFRKNGS